MSSKRYERSQLIFRPAESSDAELLWCWANDPIVREYSFSPQEIPFVNHSEWFRRKITLLTCRIYVIELESELIGQVRYERAGASEAEIDVSVAAEHRGHGLGSLALALTREAACTELKVSRVLGIVKASNNSSCAAFLKLMDFSPWIQSLHVEMM